MSRIQQNSREFVKRNAPWSKPNEMARKCSYCGTQKPGMQPLRLYHGDGTSQRGYWHLKCFEKAKKEL